MKHGYDILSRTNLISDLDENSDGLEMHTSASTLSALPKCSGYDSFAGMNAGMNDMSEHFCSEFSECAPVLCCAFSAANAKCCICVFTSYN